MFFVVVAEVPRYGSGGRVFLEKTEPRTLRAVDRLEITGTCRIARSQFQLSRGTLGSLTVAWGTSVLDGKDAMVLAIKTAGGESSLTLHLDKPSTAAPNPGKE
jgi:hypothetical protein